MVLGLGRRARTVEEAGINFGAMAEVTELQPHHGIDSEPDDVFITSWAKSGTTMTQQMFHQLRMVAATGETDMDFDDISRMTPWEDTATLLDFHVNVPQRAQPRGFKSHREYERLPSGSRYIVTLRDPHETYVSLYRFFDGWHMEHGSISLEDFMPFWLGGGPGGCDYFTHLLSWYARREEPDTLLVTYRWAAKNQPAMIRKVAGFLGIDVDEKQVAMVAHCASREFMVAHKDRFDDAMVCNAMEEHLGIPAASDSSKVQAKGSDSKVLPSSVVEAIDHMWAERVEPVTGHKDYASLAEEIDARMSRGG
ncbi:sulfotransferase domain-containing protein [Qipengyuania vesicularis]|uniref:sulfotransferase domain-containing protein n=1 Tax=Qipengyuania vesicularis TaxID=2867232 RepID=UPI001C87B6D6|nr:sulfotransferase domain-containing protein [Qipengyuania vesicularis]MBX7528018.1 sulfotransferase domain-containing protein [Qipengyuania vesicularis]